MNERERQADKNNKIEVFFIRKNEENKKVWTPL